MDKWNVLKKLGTKFKHSSRTKQGQVFFTDVTFSLIVFVIVFIFFLVLWNMYMEQLLDNVEREEMELLAFQVTDIFVNTPGAPNNWEEGADASNNIMSLGITTKDRELSPSKVQRMFALNYTELKKTLNLERYNLYLTLRHSNRTIINQTGFIPTNISTQQVSVRRLVMDGAEPREVGLILWK